MSIEFNGVEYRVGQAIRNKPQNHFADTHVGSVHYANQNCPVYRTESGGLQIKVQHLNSQWPTFYPLRTQEELLEGWS